ncbi:MAG TPA: hypothetical protein VES42_21880, partial [Pilimelia sp.]|nr:hypothetical protein [Pilimelia sp.]
PGSAVGGPRAGAGEAVLTIAYRERGGAPAADAYSALLAIDDPEASTWVAAGPDGTATVRLPRGRFHVESVVSTARPGHDVPSTSVLVNPELAVRRDLRVAVDAAAAAPVTVTVPDPAAVGESVAVSIARTAPWGRTTTSYGGAPGAVFTHHDGPAVAGGAMDTVVSAVFARPGPAGTAVDSPLVYATAWRQRGRLVTGLRQRVTEAELATVRAEHGAQGPGRRASKGLLIAHSPTTKTGHWLDYTRTPFARVERYAGNVEWANELEEYALAGEPGAEAPVDRTTQAQAPTAYEPGRRYAERWNVAPFWADAGLWRSRDRVIADPGLYGDQAGRVGTSAWRRAQVALYRDGALVGEADRLDGTVFDVPPGANRYRLTAAAERDFGGLATAVSAAWTFTSTAGAAEYTKQPLLAVRYAPPVDLRGRAPAGRTVALPVSVQVGPRDAAVRSLAVDVSYDGGRGWRPVRLAGAGARRVGLLHHPAGPGAVSLRARVADAAGDTVEHTLINADRLAGPVGAPPAS